MRRFLRASTLIWSKGQVDELDFILLIIFVISECLDFILSIIFVISCGAVITQPRTQALWLFTSLSARGKAREGEKWKIRREAPGRIRIQNGGSVFCKCSVLFILLLK